MRYRVFLTFRFWVDINAKNEAQAKALAEHEGVDWSNSDLELVEVEEIGKTEP